MNSPKNIETKEEAVMYVSATLRSPPALLSSTTFKAAMDLSRQFDVSAQDVLQYRKERAQCA